MTNDNDAVAGGDEPTATATELEPGEQLRQLRLSMGLLQGQLAEQAGVSQQTVSFLETGRVAPSPKTLKLLAKVLGGAVLEIDWPPAFKKESYNKRIPAHAPEGSPGDRLKALRLARGLSQSEVAYKLHLRENAYSRIEQGYTTSPAPEILENLADVLGPEVLEIFPEK